MKQRSVVIFPISDSPFPRFPVSFSSLTWHISLRMSAMKMILKIATALFISILSLNVQKAFSQTPPTAPTNPNPITPVPNPTNPTMNPSINPSTYPVDTSTIRHSTAPNQPAAIPPSRDPMQQPQDTVFRSIDQNPDPMKIDSVPKN